MRKLLTVSLLFLLFACQSESQGQKSTRKVQLMTPSGDVINSIFAIDPDEQEKGLSGIRPEDFADDQGMLFFYLEDNERHFWMPDTHFELDLFYLDKDLKITDIIRKLPFHKGWANPELIPRARGIWARHVLEMKSTSPIAHKLKIGDVLKWQGAKSLQETENVVRENAKKY